MSSLIERPRRALMILLAAAIIVIGVRVISHLAENQPPRNDRTTLEQLRAQFTQTAWAPNLVSAYWDSTGNLTVGLDRNDRKLALLACSDLTEVLQERVSSGPSGVVYTTTSNNHSLFIFDRSDKLLVTNFPSLNSGCQWRLK